MVLMAGPVWPGAVVIKRHELIVESLEQFFVNQFCNVGPSLDALLFVDPTIGVILQSLDVIKIQSSNRPRASSPLMIGWRALFMRSGRNGAFGSIFSPANASCLKPSSLISASNTIWRCSIKVIIATAWRIMPVNWEMRFSRSEGVEQVFRPKQGSGYGGELGGNSWCWQRGFFASRALPELNLISSGRNL